MSKNKTTSGPKYPCGICSVGVKFSGIYCTGPCNLWYHAGCVNIAEKHLKKMNKEEIDHWTCKNCNTTSASLILPTKQDHIKTNGQSPGPAPKIAEHGHQHQEKISTTSSLAEELEMVRQSVQKYEDLEETDMETSLTIAAEAGNFLLKENNNLKRDIQILSKQKSSLEDTLAGLELKLEEMTEQEKNRNPAGKIA
ncbi:hypothetical protein J6590_036504 [Homalodisca vitripennis]|nr:hypothetical protein J6590_036504 [Homalodisca vitripennis]